jgi:hypothetical protein
MLDFRKRLALRGFLFVAMKVIAVRTEITRFSGVYEDLMIFLKTSVLVSVLVSGIF